MSRRARVRKADGGARTTALARRALREDLGAGDITTRSCLPPNVWASARVRARRRTVVCGLTVAERVFRALDHGVRWNSRCRDGQEMPAGAVLATVEGPARALLASERVALNFLQHLSGIATRTRRCVRAVRGMRVQILDTRKTHPGLRELEKYAVRCGGGRNHRLRLDDGILIKDNHVALTGSVTAAVSRARRKRPRARIMVEADTLSQVREAVAAGADLVLLDNFPAPRIERAVRLFGRRVTLEASGGIQLRHLRRLARTGVARLSLGSLTHSVEWADIGLDLVPAGRTRGRRARD